MRKVPAEKLNKWVRLHIYKYLDVKETMKVAVLSMKERQSMEKSEITKEGKSMIIRLDNFTRKDICLLCTTDGTTDGVTKWLQLFQAAIRHVDTISIVIGKLCIRETGCSNPAHPDLD